MSGSLRVCFVATSYPDNPDNVRSSFIQRMALLLSERGVAVTVVTPRIRRDSKLQEDVGPVRVYRYPFWSEDRLLADYDRIPYVRMITYLASGLITSCRAVSSHNCDLLHGHWILPDGFVAAVTARVMHRPLVLSAHGTDVLKWGRRPLTRPLARWTVAQSSACSANSMRMKECLRELGGPAAHLPVVYESGVDPARFSRDASGAAWRKRLGLSGEHCVVLFLGHLVRRKGVDVLIEAAGLLHQRGPHFHLVIAGEGPERDSLQAQARQHGLQTVVHFTGAVAHQQAHELFACADVFVLPSREEALGIVVMEAMASGKPVVASAVDGLPDLVLDGTTGLLCPAEDSQALAAALESLVRDRRLRERMGQAGRLMVEDRYTEAIQVAKVEEMYRRALGRADTH